MADSTTSDRALVALAARCLLLPLVLLAGCDRDDIDYAVGTIERHRIDLVADSAEPIIALHVQEGDRVSVGQALAEQDPGKTRIALARASAEAANARARLAEAKTGPRAQEIDQARAQLAAAESNLKTLQQELKRQQSLIARNYSSESQVEILEGRVSEAGARKEEIQAKLAELLEGTRTEQVDQARAGYAASQAQVEDLTIDLERTVIRAPVAGVVDAIAYRLGERPPRGQTVLTLLASDRTFARVHIPEPLRTRLASGDAARIRVDGHESDYPGRIRWISSEAAFTPYYSLTQQDRSRLAYLAEVDLEQDADLPNGVPVEVRFPDLVPDR